MTEKIVEAWRKASEDLNIEIEAPYFLVTEENNRIEYPILVKRFGRTHGTLIATIDNNVDFKSAENLAFYYSALNPECYSKYRRDAFIELLTDWGYFGAADKKPSWYNGHLYITEL